MNTETLPSDAQVVTEQSPAWWAHALRGVLAVVFGLIALARPSATAAAIVLVFAVYAVTDGLAALVASFRRGRAGQRWSWFLLEGIASIAVGVVAFAHPAATFLGLLVLVAIRAIVVGVLDVAGAITGRWIEWRWLWALSGVLSIAFGVLLLARPCAGAVAVLWMIGAYAVIAGITAFTFGLHLRWIERREHDAELHLGGHAATT
jgi:uncharacterized membrane protein HdeD (DUF308 family)